MIKDKRLTNNSEAPKWIGDKKKWDSYKTRKEIEIKFLIKKKIFDDFLESKEFITENIEQYYLNREISNKICAAFNFKDVSNYDEWRVRKKGDKFVFTAKADANSKYERDEFEEPISKDMFENTRIEVLNSKFSNGIKKTRVTKKQKIGQFKVTIEADFFSEIAGKQQKHDFAFVEISLDDSRLIPFFTNSDHFVGALKFLENAIELSGIKEFSNHNLAFSGMPGSSLSELVEFINTHYLNEIGEQVRHNISSAKIMTNRLASIVSERDRPNSSHFDSAGVLSSLAFQTKSSMGRKNNLDNSLKALDKNGHGWSRDFQVLVSSDPFLRLFKKPQIYRRSLGGENTTTRGQHTLDVIGTSARIATELGLNVNLCTAAAALHDIGHPPGGHVGEEELTKLSGRVFQHHVFSLSLSQIFDLDLLKETQLCSLYHKSGGAALIAEDGVPDEFAVLRIADKLSYTPWDIYDSVDNGFLARSEIAKFEDILGEKPFDWLQTLIGATIEESKEKLTVSFTSDSGEIYHAFKEARDLVYDKVHPQLNWNQFKFNLKTVYEKIAEDFQGYDPVPIVAFMTDWEIETISKAIDEKKKDYVLTKEYLTSIRIDGIKILEKLENRNDIEIFYNLDSDPEKKVRYQ